MTARKATIGQIEAALRKHAGIKSLAANELGVTRAAIQQRVDASPHLQQVIRDVEDRVGDVCEGHIIKDVNKGDKQMCRWYAAHKLRHRGYATRVETEIKIPDEEIEAIASAFGGDSKKIRAALAALDGRQSGKP